MHSPDPPPEQSDPAPLDSTGTISEAPSTEVSAMSAQSGGSEDVQPDAQPGAPEHQQLDTLLSAVHDYYRGLEK